MMELLAKFFLWGCWVITYVLIIRRTWLDKSPGMPFSVLCMNLSWEAMMLFFHEFLGLGWITVFVWLMLDIVMLAQYFVYARPVTTRTLADKLFWQRSIAILLVGIGTPLAITFGFADYEGLIAAYFQNALMSILFVAMLISRDSLRGQSVYIAIAKFLGTGVAITYGEPSGIFLGWCYALIMAFDVAYIALIVKVGRRDGIAVFRRF